MHNVFVSHAAADVEFVDQFVDTVLRLGCGLTADELFYSSGADTGIASGSDLLHTVRERVSDAGLVAAVISPTFQTRPVCLAELGAAWSRTDNLFPIAVPGMARTDMDGVLKGMLVKHADDDSALDELHERVGAVIDRQSKTTTWGRYKATWLATAKHYSAKVPTPTVVTIGELEAERAKLAGAQAALEASEDKARALESQRDKLAAATSAEERAQALLPENEVERFHALVAEASSAVRRLDAIVREVLFYELAEGSMPRPDAFDDRHRLELVEEAIREGDLVDDDGRIGTDDQIAEVAAANKLYARSARCWSTRALSNSTSGFGRPMARRQTSQSVAYGPNSSVERRSDPRTRHRSRNNSRTKLSATHSNSQTTNPCKQRESA